MNEPNQPHPVTTDKKLEGLIGQKPQLPPVAASKKPTGPPAQNWGAQRIEAHTGLPPAPEGKAPDPTFDGMPEKSAAALKAVNAAVATAAVVARSVTSGAHQLRESLAAVKDLGDDHPAVLLADFKRDKVEKLAADLEAIIDGLRPASSE